MDNNSADYYELREEGDEGPESFFALREFDTLEDARLDGNQYRSEGYKGKLWIVHVKAEKVEDVI